MSEESEQIQVPHATITLTPMSFHLLMTALSTLSNIANLHPYPAWEYMKLMQNIATQTGYNLTFHVPEPESEPSAKPPLPKRGWWRR